MAKSAEGQEGGPMQRDPIKKSDEDSSSATHRPHSLINSPANTMIEDSVALGKEKSSEGQRAVGILAQLTQDLVAMPTRCVCHGQWWQSEMQEKRLRTDEYGELRPAWYPVDGFQKIFY